MERESLLREKSYTFTQPTTSSLLGESLKLYAHYSMIILIFSALVLLQLVLFYKDTTNTFIQSFGIIMMLIGAFSGFALISVCFCFIRKSHTFIDLSDFVRGILSTGKTSRNIRPTFFMNELQVWSNLGFWGGIREFGDLLPWLVSLSFVGHVSTTDLAALSLVEVFIYTVMDLSWWAVSMTESVLVSQAHGCRCLLSMRGWGVMSFIVMTVCNISLTVFCVFCEQILLIFGFDRVIALRGATYALYIIPAFFAEGVTICVATYLTAFQEASSPAHIQLIAGILHITITYVLVFGFPGFHGMSDALVAAALGWVVSSFFSCFLNLFVLYQLWGKELEDVPDGSHDNPSMPLCYQNQSQQNSPRNNSIVKNLNLKKDFEVDPSERRIAELEVMIPHTTKVEKEIIIGISIEDNVVYFSEVLSWVSHSSHWMKYFKQAFPNFATTGMQSLSMFVMSLLAAKLGDYEIAAHNSSVALFEVLYTVCQGMGEGTSIRIGYHVGKGDIQAAKNVMWISFIISLCWGVIVGAAANYLRDDIAEFLSNDSEVKLRSVTLAPVVWSSYFVFSVGGQCLSVLDGQGRASAQAASFFVGSCLVSIPLFFLSSIWMDWGLNGLWGSLMLGDIVTVALGVFFIHCSNWPAIVRDAKERNSDENEPE